MRLHVIVESLLSQREGFLRLANGIQNESFHGLGIAMVRGLLEDLVRSLDSYDN